VPNILIMNGTYMLPYAISLSGIGTFKSGLPVDPQAGTDLNGDGFTTDRPGTLERNSFRLSTWKSVDISVAKSFGFGGAQAIELRMDVFNLLNAMNVTQVNAVYGRVVGSPVAAFMQPTRVANPRQFQFAARYRF